MKTLVVLGTWLLLFLFVIALLATPALATALTSPTTLEVIDVHVFTNMIQPHDQLYIVHWNISWGNSSDVPFLPINKTFRFVLQDSSGNVTGNITGIGQEWTNGYEQGLVSFYFPGNTTDPAWGDLGNVTIIGSSLWGNSTPSVTYTLQSTDFTSYTSPADVREELRQYLISMAMFLDLSWNDYWLAKGAASGSVELLQWLSDSATYVFSAAGESYFGAVIPNLGRMCPALYALQLSEITYTAQTHTGNASTEAQNQWIGTPVDEFRHAVSDMMGGVGTTTAFTFLTLVFVLGNMMFVSMKWGKAYPGLMVAWGPVLILTRMGFPDMAIVMLCVMAAFMLCVYILFMRPSQG